MPTISCPFIFFLVKGLRLMYDCSSCFSDKSGQSHHDAPRSEKFAPGEVYFSTSLSRVHVLPPLYPVTPMATHNQQMSTADNKQKKRLSTGDSRHHEGNNSLVLPLTGLSNSPSVTNRNGGTNFHVQNQHISMPWYEMIVWWYVSTILWLHFQLSSCFPVAIPR